MNLELDTYTPSEAEMITGVVQTTVRNWRRAGHLERSRGHARYHIGDLLRMYVMKELVARGVKVEVAKGFASEAASAIFSYMLWAKKMYTDEVWASAGLDDNKPTAMEWLAVLEKVAESAEQTFGVAGLKRPDWLVIWANGNAEFLYDRRDENGEGPDESFFSNIQHDHPFAQGPIILFCLGAWAHVMMERLPRPPIRLGEA